MQVITHHGKRRDDERINKDHTNDHSNDDGSAERTLSLRSLR